MIPGESERFRVLFAGNRKRVADSYNFEKDFSPIIGRIVVDVTKEAIRGGNFSFGYGYGPKDNQPMIRFCDQDSYCEKNVPLLSYLKEMDAFYRDQLNPDVDGDPVEYRFVRFMLAGVKHFLKEERAGNNPQ